MNWGLPLLILTMLQALLVQRWVKPNIILTDVSGGCDIFNNSLLQKLHYRFNWRFCVFQLGKETDPQLCLNSRVGRYFREFSNLYTALIFKWNSLNVFKNELLKKGILLEMESKPSKLTALTSLWVFFFGAIWSYTNKPKLQEVKISWKRIAIVKSSKILTIYTKIGFSIRKETKCTISFRYTLNRGRLLKGGCT